MGLRLSSILLLIGVCALSTVSARSKDKDKEISEDSLQSLAAQNPENPTIWMKLGTLAARNNQVDLAKGYFDEAIKLGGRSAKMILDVGDIWLSLGKVKQSLPYLMPNLNHLDPKQLDQLQFGLEKEKMFSVQLIVLRNLGSRTESFLPVNRRAAALAFRLGDNALCASILSKFPDQLDYESARNLLLINFFLAGTLDAKIIETVVTRFPQAEIGMLANLNYAQQTKWRNVRNFLQREANAPSYRDYYNLLKAMDAAGDDRNDEAVQFYQKAAETAWDRLKVVINADLYHLYSSTGNKFKSDQVWDNLKEEYGDQDPDLQEFMGKQLLIRGYEKQAKYFFRVVLRRRPGNTVALSGLWDDLMGNEDYQTLTDNLKALLDRDPFSCEGNTMAMNFYFRQKNDKELLPYARNAAVYCYESLEPYYILGTTLLNLSKPDEAKTYFATYIRKGGDVNRVPMNAR